MAKKRTRNQYSRRRKRPDTVRLPRPGAPAADSVTAVLPFRSPSGRTYQVIKTTELDAYDKLQAQKAPKRRRRDPK